MAFGRGSDRLEAPAVPQDDNGRPGQLFPYELVSEIDAMQYGFPSEASIWNLNCAAANSRTTSDTIVHCKLSNCGNSV
jgi:hypothetical protein